MKKSFAIIGFFVAGCAAESPPVLNAAERGEGCPVLNSATVEVLIHDSRDPLLMEWTGTSRRVSRIDSSELASYPITDHLSSYLPYLQGCASVDGLEACRPQSTSPDGVYEVRSLYDKSGVARALQIIKVAGKEATARIPIEQVKDGQTWVQAVAWSDDSNYFAMIVETQTLARNSIAAFLSPHPAQVTDIAAWIGNVSGQVLCKTVVARKRASGVPAVRWR